MKSISSWKKAATVAVLALCGAGACGARQSASSADVEQTFRAVPNAAEMERHHRAMRREPHHPGTEAQRRTADYYRSKLVEWGCDARIYEYQVLVPYPRGRQAELIAPDRYALTLDEPAVKEDPDTSVTLDPVKGALTAFNAYSPSGDVTAELVYVNYGLPVGSSTSSMRPAFIPVTPSKHCQASERGGRSGQDGARGGTGSTG